MMIDTITLLTTMAPLFLAIAMFGMGLTMKLADIKYLSSNVNAVLAGLLLQVVLLPLLGFAVVLAFSLEPVLAIGVMLLAACPGGPGSNLVSYLSKGDVALSVTLTTLSSLLAIVTVPLITHASLMYFQDQRAESFSLVQLIAVILVVTLLPITAGVITGKRSPQFAQRCEKLVKLLTFVFILLLVMATILKEIGTINEMLSTLGLPLAVFCLSAVGISFLMTRLLSLSGQHQRTIAIEAGIQNPVLSVVVAGTFLNSASFAIPAAVYPVIMLSVSLMFIISAQFIRPHQQANNPKQETSNSSLEMG